MLISIASYYCSMLNITSCVEVGKANEALSLAWAENSPVLAPCPWMNIRQVEPSQQSVWHFFPAELFFFFFFNTTNALHVPMTGLKPCLVDARQVFGSSVAELSPQTFWHALEWMLRHNLRHISPESLTELSVGWYNELPSWWSSVEPQV